MQISFENSKGSKFFRVSSNFQLFQNSFRTIASLGFLGSTLFEKSPLDRNVLLATFRLFVETSFPVEHYQKVNNVGLFKFVNFEFLIGK